MLAQLLHPGHVLIQGEPANVDAGPLDVEILEQDRLQFLGHAVSDVAFVLIEAVLFSL